MLGKTAGGLFWMFRNLERSENNARLLDAGLRISLTRPSTDEEWASVITTAGANGPFSQKYERCNAASVIDFLLRDPDNPSSVIRLVEQARSNARLVRTALTSEVWEATNDCWLNLKALLARPVRERELPEVLAAIRQQSALVRGALHGTMLRNDIYDFSRLGTFIERADSTARILDVKYYVLLPTVSFVGSSLDNVQWESILRSVSAHRAYRWLNPNNINAKLIADFLILDRRMPRSLAFSYSNITDNLGYLEEDYGVRLECHDMAERIAGKLRTKSIQDIFDYGLHEYLERFIGENAALAKQIETDFRFYG